MSLLRAVPKTIKIIQATDVILGIPAEHDAKILLTKVPHTLTSKHGKTNLVLIRRLPSCFLCTGNCYVASIGEINHQQY